MAITSDQVSPIRPIGSAVTLTCTVELSPLVDVPVIVSTVWTGPYGFTTTNAAHPAMGRSTTYTSRVVVSSFGREQSGKYNCTSRVISSQKSPYLNDSSAASGSAAVTVGEMHNLCVIQSLMTLIMSAKSLGVYISLKETVYANNSVISIREIGETRSYGLQCVTDKKPCCNSEHKAGEWYFPNGSIIIAVQENHGPFFVSRDDRGKIILNYVNGINDILSPSGPYCCGVQDANGLKQSLCAIISELTCLYTPI